MKVFLKTSFSASFDKPHLNVNNNFVAQEHLQTFKKYESKTMTQNWKSLLKRFTRWARVWNKKIFWANFWIGIKRHYLHFILNLSFVLKESKMLSNLKTSFAASSSSKMSLNNINYSLGSLCGATTLTINLFRA